ncbi:hypothetical protein ABFY09_05470 [Marinomonas sp. 5E14-1]|uniref:hypothetical protein n=1 Tax=Marinomonas sp. 5E14-1 TaxID=3153922 RepID=UPI003265E220
MNLSKKHKDAINLYIRSKDNNKPYLMGSVFEDLASLTMEVKTDEIAFPSETVGLDSITNVLVRNFNRTYEDIYTFCITDSVVSNDQQTLCKWVVVMRDSEKENIRVGYGDYKWTFNNELVSQLTITIEKMIALDENESSEIFSWLNKQSYPWCDSADFLEEMPASISFLKHGLTR